MYVNESLQTKWKTQKTQKNQICLQRKKALKALNDLIAFVNKRVIEKNIPTEVSQLLERYQRAYINECGKQDNIEAYTNQRLVNKLRNHFDNTVLNIMSDSIKKLIAWTKGDMPFNFTSCLAKE